MSIATYLNTGLAILGWAYIMVKTGQWITKKCSEAVGQAS